VAQRGPRLKTLPQAGWVLMKELLAELTILRKRLEMLQAALKLADKQQRSKLLNRLRPQFPALGGLHPMLQELYNKLER
jgi:hypothetical protein